MQPTFNVGDRVQFETDSGTSYHLGDIVLVHPPQGAVSAPAECGRPVASGQLCPQPTATIATDTLFVKRIVAGPGDQIAVIGGRVVLNGRLQSEPFTKPCDGGEDCDFPTPITVPAGMYFVLGDNRGASDDSRFWGPVPRAAIAGKAVRCSFFNTICNDAR